MFFGGGNGIVSQGGFNPNKMLQEKMKRELMQKLAKRKTKKDSSGDADEDSKGMHLAKTLRARAKLEGREKKGSDESDAPSQQKSRTVRRGLDSQEEGFNSGGITSGGIAGGAGFGGLKEMDRQRGKLLHSLAEKRLQPKWKYKGEEADFNFWRKTDKETSDSEMKEKLELLHKWYPNETLQQMTE